MSDKGYNGWSNYETWAFALWMDNEEPTYYRARELAKEAKDAGPEDDNVASGIWTADRAAVYRLAGTLAVAAEEEMPEVEGVWSDLLRAALSEVNWSEIAENLLQEIEEP